MTEDKCRWCGCEIEKDWMCLELWLRVPEEEEMKEALRQAAQLVTTASGIRPEFRIREGYITPAERFCSFPCLAQYAVLRWEQTDLIKNAARDSFCSDN